MPDRPSPFRTGAHAQPSVGPRVRDVKEWVRQAAGVPEDATIVVSELSCSEPGCPPYEVVMAILLAGEPPRQRKLHRRLRDLTEAEVRRLWAAGGYDHEHDRSESEKE